MNTFTDEELAEIRRKNVQINGKVWHLMKLAEECAELNRAIIGYFTKGDSESHIVAEAADVEIALENLRLIYSLGVDEAKDAKFKRIAARIKEQEDLTDRDHIVDFLRRLVNDFSGGIP